MTFVDFVLPGMIGAASVQIGYWFGKWRGWPWPTRQRVMLITGALGVLVVMLSHWAH